MSNIILYEYPLAHPEIRFNISFLFPDIEVLALFHFKAEEGTPPAILILQEKIKQRHTFLIVDFYIEKKEIRWLEAKEMWDLSYLAGFAELFTYAINWAKKKGFEM